MEDDLVRVLSLTGATDGFTPLVRRLSAPAPGTGGFQLRPTPASIRTTYNSGYPSGSNDRLLWAGRGASALVGAGVRARWGPVSVAVAPEVAFQQNADFEVREHSRSGYSPYADAFHSGIDLPQRFGPDSFVAASPGQSYARVDLAGFGAGVSTENLWWGPGARYPLLMSSNAPGFPHLFAGTSRPVDIWIGTVEAEMTWGELRESAWFDENAGNDHTAFAGLAAAFSPRGLNGLSVGIVRAYQYRSEDRWPRDAQPVLEVFGGSEVNRPGNELFSIFGRWVFPESGAEVYGEWGRDDRWYDFAELVQEPDHSQAYMLGFQKVTSLREATALRVHFEMIALQEMGELRSGSRPLPQWYTHSQVRQGYTHRGQILGSAVGPGGDAQFLGVDAIEGWGMAGLFVERIRRNDATAAALEGRRYWPREHDTELIFGLRGLYLATSSLSVGGRVSRAHRYNREFLDDDRNIALVLEARWLPRISLQP